MLPSSLRLLLTTAGNWMFASTTAIAIKGDSTTGWSSASRKAS